ncbi:hypothetical protein PHET_03205 [Paragonimus heterotremus]|uniref:Uncharacterized protein n=1 Tax=Paragonimus heterotremus TaxID=100268 RepID=A0A8J4WJF2_9TREM|nr:hypothetical protein PHET_03205 [Paragonimus heterotremus]
MRLLRLKRHRNQADRKDANVSTSPLEKGLLHNYDRICDSINLRQRNSRRKPMCSLSKCQSRLWKLQTRNAKLKHSQLKQKEDAEVSGKLCILEEILDDALACTELLFVLTDYIKDMEARLKNKRKLVQKLALQNQKLQKNILAMHEDWLSSVRRCEELEMQYRAWLFALTSEDANFFIFNSLTDQSCLDVSYKKIWQEDSTKLNFQRLVDESWQAKDYHTSVHIAVDALNWSRVYPPSKQHRFPPQSIIELPRAVNYIAQLAVRCFNINNQSLSIFCANYAVKLLTNLRIDKKFQPADNTLNWRKRVQVFPKLICVDAHETDWAILLDAVRKIVSVYWRIGQFSEAVGLLKSILNLRSTIIWESRTGCTQLGCLLTAGLYLFAGQVSLQTQHPGEKENLVTLRLFELCVTWSEGALSAALVESSNRHKNAKSVDLMMEPQLDALFLLWALMLEVLCRYCANLGATNDVLLLGCRLVNILSMIKPWGEVDGVQLSQLLYVALLAEKNCVNRDLREDPLQNSGGHVLLDNYLHQFRCIETSESVESIFHETVLVCRGQQWNTAAALIEWWITGCRLLRHGLAARRRRIRQTQMPQLTFDKLDQLKRRAVVFNFLKFLAEISTGNGSIGNAETSRLSSTLWIGKHRDCEPADIRCDFSQTPTDPRMRVFGLAYKNRLPIFMEELDKLYLSNENVDKSVGLSENSFLLQSNRKLFTWWKQSDAEGRLTEIPVRYPLELMLNKKDIIGLWEDVRCLSYSECNSLLPHKHKQQLITGQRPQVTSTPKKMHLIPDLNPFPVAESLSAIMHADYGLNKHSERSDDALKSNNLENVVESIHLEMPVKEITFRSKGCNKIMERKIGCWDSFRKKRSSMYIIRMNQRE